MKKPILHTLFIALFVFGSANLMAGTETATMSDDFKIEIAEISADNQYVLNCDLDFANFSEKAKYFDAFFENLMSFSTDLTTGEVTIHLRADYLHNAWTVAEWNVFLATHQERFKASYNKMKASIGSH